MREVVVKCVDYYYIYTSVVDKLMTISLRFYGEDYINLVEMT